MTKITKQKYLKSKGLIIMIAIMNMVIPLSTDIYLPAVPEMKSLFKTSETMVNFTLVGFFFFLAIGMLIFGPLSDKYGRKPLLITGSAVYALLSGACGFAFSIEFLIIARIIQALGAGCMIAVSTALIKDCFREKKRDSVLAVIQAMSVIGPMAAPLMGAWIITISGWRATFVVLTAIAVICLVGSILMQETLPEEDRHSGNIKETAGRMLDVAKNKGFTVYLLTAAMFSAPYMAYIAVSSYIYIDYFSLSETMYSYFFAFNSAASIIGPIIYVKINGKVQPKFVVWTVISGSVICGILLITVGWITPFIFMLSFLPFTVLNSALRPFSTSILLDQQRKDTGSASSLMNFVFTVSGSIGMMLGALKWNSFISGLGIILIGFAFLAFFGWIYILKSGTKVRGLTTSRFSD